MTRIDQPVEQRTGAVAQRLPAILRRAPSARRAGATGGLPSPQHPARPRVSRPLTADMPAPLAFATLARAPLERLGEAERLAAAELTPDMVHDLRVAARRLRALLAAFAPCLDGDAVNFLRGELSWAQHSLAAARDWDVFLQGCLAPLAAGRARSGLRLLLGAANRRREQAYLDVEKALARPRFARLVLRFRYWLDGLDPDGFDTGSDGGASATALSVTAVLGEALQRRYRKIAKADGHDEMSEDELHRLRLRVKKLRDLTDFAKPFYAKPLRDGRRHGRFAKRLNALQGELGALQDATVARDMIRALAVGMPAAAQDAAGFVAERQARIVAKQRRRSAAAWADFAELKKFWRKAL